ncbi:MULTISPECIES: TetR/AcrR family transcriptional regulator [Frankia]|nr:MULTISPECIES: hypothetical protein [Frankia]
MLRAAVDMVNRTGLTVSLDHISMEDVIRDAGVSRSAVYRRWPYKDLFVIEVVRELARHATPTIEHDEVALLRRVLAERPNWFETPELRRDLVVTLFRELALLDFQIVYESADWRTYVALHATFLSLTDSELRDEVGAALAQSERDHTTRVARSWEQLAALFGYRLRPGLAATFETLASLLGASMRGLFLMALSNPDIAAQRMTARPFGASEPGEWSLPAFGVASIASAFLEPDPAVDWGESRIIDVRHALERWTVPDLPADDPGDEDMPGDPKVTREERTS